MSLKDYLKIDFLLDILFEWGKAFLNPLDTVERLNNAASDKDKFKGATKLLLTAYILSIIIQLPIYTPRGITWDRVDFHLITGLIVLLALVVACGGIYYGFRAFGIAVEFIYLYVLIIILIGNYIPLIALIFYPGTIYLLRIIDHFKNLNLKYLEILEEVFKPTGVSSIPFEMYHGLAGFYFIFTCGMLAYLVRILAAALSTSKVSLQKALAFGLIAFGSIPLALLFCLQLFVFYSYL